MKRGKVKLFLDNYHLATVWLDEIKDMSQNGPYWFIKMKYHCIFINATCASITYDENEPVGYFSKKSN